MKILTTKITQIKIPDDVEFVNYSKEELQKIIYEEIKNQVITEKVYIKLNDNEMILIEAEILDEDLKSEINLKYKPIELEELNNTEATLQSKVAMLGLSMIQQRLIDQQDPIKQKEYLHLAIYELIQNYGWGNYSTEYNGNIFRTTGFDEEDNEKNLDKYKEIFIDTKKESICSFIIPDFDNFKTINITINDPKAFINFIKSVESDLGVSIFGELDEM